MDNKLIELINSLPEELRNILITQDANGNYIINGDKFQEVLDKSHPGEDDTIIELFFRQICQDQWKDIGYEKIEPLMPTLKHICKDVGFKEINNPFLHFVHSYIINNDTLKNEDLIDVNNLYARGIISYEDLQNDGEQDSGLPSIIYVPDLYKSADVDKLVKSYIWLGDDKNLEKMNWQNIYDNHISSKIDSVAKAILEQGVDSVNGGKDKYIRTQIMFKDPSSWTLNSDDTIDRVLKLGATDPNKKFGETSSQVSNKQTSQRKLNDVNDIVSELRNLSVDEQRAFINQLTSKLGL